MRRPAARDVNEPHRAPSDIDAPPSAMTSSPAAKHGHRSIADAVSFAAAIAVACLATGCAMTMERPVEPFASETIEVAPNAFYESCVALEAGDRLLFSYLSDPPMTFSIRRHIGNAEVSYLVRDRAFAWIAVRSWWTARRTTRELR